MRSFYLTILLTGFLLTAPDGLMSQSTSSALSAGKWYKLAVVRTGIHQVTYAGLTSMGINPETIDVDKIRLFGNGSGMLPEQNSAPRTDDLREVALEIHDGQDGRMDPGDYFLFYGEGADKWVFEKQTRFFSHQRNLYSDTTYYFLNMDQGPGRRVAPLPFMNLTPNYESAYFDYPLSHESDLYNPVRSGQQWYGEVFDLHANTLDIPFYVPNIDSTAPIRIKTSVVGKSSAISWFIISRKGVKIDSLKIEPTDPKEYTRAGKAKIKQTTLAPGGADQTLNMTYPLPTPNTSGWLDYIEMTTRCHLVWNAPQMTFRDVLTTGPDRITRYLLRQANPQISVWDITNPSSILNLGLSYEEGTATFIRPTDSLREFIAYDGSGFYQPRFVGEVHNQNLHSHTPTTLLIVAHPLFLAQAERLATYHREQTGMTVRVADVMQVFNEFACGQPDPTAIRDYVRMLHDRGSGENKLKYLLLFGDGSYDPKNRVPGNNNLVPTFQSAESLNSTTTFVTDDYFGIMAPASGSDANGVIEIGIGRFPVSTVAEATSMVDKIISYSGKQKPVRSDWRNVITFLADDEDRNLHLNQAEELAQIVKSKYPVFNVSKIYFDAYKMEKIPGGERFPDATLAINDAVAKGSLLINYTGHGGENGWSYEQVITTADILSWKNAAQLPVFVTATCEFSRFDNPERYTAGEMLINQPEGGAIALYSTTRLAFAGLNILLNKSFFEHLMDKDHDGNFIRMGDLIRLSKNDNKNNFQLRNFVLLGDPAQQIAFPEHVVRTKHINDWNADLTDTVHGLTMVRVNGQLENGAGDKLTDFNGILQCKVFDKPNTYVTLGNRPNGITFPAPFQIQDRLLFSGEVPVNEGEFWVTFPVPKGISLQYGRGKISYYALDSTRDANGYNSNMVIGGLDPSTDPVNDGPEIGLFLDDRNFQTGQMVGPQPVLIADLADTNGINWLGLGIGHEIVMVLDNDYPHARVLNDHFSPWFNSWSGGSLEYPLPALPPGKHTLSLRAWDLFDNSSLKEITFVVPEPDKVHFADIRVAPNPMATSTQFIFIVNQELAEDVNITVTIYDLQGREVATLRSTISGHLPAQHILQWDGTASSGALPGSGIYPFRIRFDGKNGTLFETIRKLMILR